MDEKKFISIVCFSNQARVKVQKVQNIVYIDTIVELIKKYDTQLIKEDIYDVASIIQENNIVDKNLRKRHIDSINQIKSDLNCPKCSGILKKTKDKNGYFYGCSNYPKCNYSRKTNHIKE